MLKFLSHPIINHAIDSCAKINKSLQVFFMISVFILATSSVQNNQNPNFWQIPHTKSGNSTLTCYLELHCILTWAGKYLLALCLCFATLYVSLGPLPSKKNQLLCCPPLPGPSFENSGKSFQCTEEYDPCFPNFWYFFCQIFDIFKHNINTF